MDRAILHIDMNNFYASVETLYDPALRDVPMVVGGDRERRHGIVLAKNQLAKARSVRTAETLWEAERKCPGLVIVPPHFERYEQYSLAARAIYNQYTDMVESFGMDECWLDVTGSRLLFGPGRAIADEIRERIKSELGLTVSVGVSFNKIFAKLGSDYKKPDATTEFSRENYRELVWPLPVGDLLFVGRSTAKTLEKYGIYTIGDAARADRLWLRRILGKGGEVIGRYARGEDDAPVALAGETHEAKSIGNSTTAVRDLRQDGEIRAELYALSEKVAQRLRESGLCGFNVQLSVRTYDLATYQHQRQLPVAVADSESIFQAAYGLFLERSRGESVRALGVRVSALAPADMAQCSLFDDGARSRRQQRLETAVDGLRGRYGRSIVQRGVQYAHADLFRRRPTMGPQTVNPFKGVEL